MCQSFIPFILSFLRSFIHSFIHSFIPPTWIYSSSARSKPIVQRNHHLGRHYWTNDNKLRLEGVMAFGAEAEAQGTLKGAKDKEGKMVEKEKERCEGLLLKRVAYTVVVGGGGKKKSYTASGNGGEEKIRQNHSLPPSLSPSLPPSLPG